MSLSSLLKAELQGRVGQTNQTFSAVEGPRTLRLSFDQCEKLAVTMAELRLESRELAGATVAQLEKASKQLAAKVNYLLEPIAPVETDSEGCSVQMRSSPPQRDEDGRRYFELLLKRGGWVSLSRYEKPTRGPRLRVPAVLTHEVLVRLADDFSNAIDGI